MLGGFSVGKTSLVKRYVQSVFSETYLTTVGVKIDKKTVDLPDRSVNLILWDLAGEDDISSLRMSYLRGSAGYVLVADGTRRTTLDVATIAAPARRSGLRPAAVRAVAEQERSQGAVGDPRRRSGGPPATTAGGCAPTSARTGEGVEDAFTDLAVRIVALSHGRPAREPGRTAAEP